MPATPLITPVILAGGSGSRLWPMSAGARPKQFHALAGAGSLLQQTVRRVADPALFSAPMIIAGIDHEAQLHEQLDVVGVAASALIFEPVGRNTAAAIALAALESDPDALLLVMPSDHRIADLPAFLAAVRDGARHAQAGYLVTYGARADRPETGYGYILRGEEIAPATSHVARFVEKPDRATAARYVADGRFSWNAGIFLFQARHMIAALQDHAADILAAVRDSLHPARRDANRLYPDAGRFAAVRPESIDFAVMEKHDRIAVVEVEMGWSDLGSWDSLYDAGEKDGSGNVLHGNVEPHDSRSCLLHSDGPLLVALGVEDLIVIASGDVVMVLPRGDSQRVKEAMALAAERRPRRSGG